MSSLQDQDTAILDLDAVTLMQRLGIRCIPMNYFYVGGYRYTQLKDAVAEAERQEVYSITDEK